ncbi:MAG: DUF1592 domain-containing protein [Deltaproteobacteria bacterium]|nr:DUF1592 domain-containing protein [Deltaproteobacteria bacterium]
MTRSPVGSAPLWFGLVLIPLLLISLGCPEVVPPPPPAVEAPPSPVRRLTEEELNRTLRDLFPTVALPQVAVTEDTGKDFAQLESKQAVSDLYVEQIRAGANAVAAVVGAAQPIPADAEQVAAVDAVLADLLPRAFRREVPQEERAFFVDYFGEQRLLLGFAPAFELVLQAVLQSPSFLYRLELDASGDADDLGRVPVSSIEMATRLSYFLWGSTPDAELLQAGLDGDLADPDNVTRQAARLLADTRAMEAIQSFHRQWLDFDRVLQTNKSPTRFPTYNEFLRTAMRDEATRFIDLVFEQDAKLRTLLTSRQTRLIPALGPVYGVDVAEDDQLVELPAERSGILTQAQFLAARGHAVEGSPVLRGVFILERLVCEAPPAPGGDIDTTPPQPEEDGNAPRTNRARYAQHEDQVLCAGCHKPIDGIGFGLEGFDSVGTFREVDNGLPVDASGNLDGTRIGGTFDGAAELGEKLADSPQVARCVSKHWFQFANGRRDVPGDAKDIDDVNAVFTDSDGDVRELLKAIVLSDAFRLRRTQ